MISWYIYAIGSLLFKVFLKIHDYDPEYKLDVIGPLWDGQTVREFNSIKKRYPESSLFICGKNLDYIASHPETSPFKINIVPRIMYVHEAR